MALPSNSWRRLLLHVSIMIVVAMVLILGFFLFYLPNTTKHGESITVPDLVGMSFEEMTEMIERRRLRFEVTEDSMYSADHEAYAILQQYPLANSKVKENRRIYVTLNAKNPPMVRMPQLVDGSVKSAQLVLKSYDLLLGEIRYVPDIAANAVIRQFYKGQVIEPGTYIPKGVRIDLEVGDGLGNQGFESPKLTGLSLDDAIFAIVGSGLKVGEVFYAVNGKAIEEKVDDLGNITTIEKDIAPGSVFKQRPLPGNPVSIGQSIDLWVVKKDTTSQSLDKIFQ